MNVTPKTLEAFRASLAERGLSENTMRLYSCLVAACARDPHGMTARLTEGDLAAKSLRANKAALRAWGDFAGDTVLVAKVKKIRLPPAVRAKPKIPFEHATWKALIQRIRTSAELEPAVRAALFLIAVRGLRVSDALRIKRTEVMSALRTGTLSFEAKGRRRNEYDAEPIREALRELAEIRGTWVRVSDLIVTDRCITDGAKKNAAAYKCVDRALRTLAKKMKIRDVHAHRFRRTYATQFLKNLGPDPQAVLKVMAHVGWSNVQTAMGYVDAVNREELNKVGSDLTKDLLK